MRGFSTGMRSPVAVRVCSVCGGALIVLALWTTTAVSGTARADAPVSVAPVARG